MARRGTFSSAATSARLSSGSAGRPVSAMAVMVMTIARNSKRTSAKGHPSRDGPALAGGITPRAVGWAGRPSPPGVPLLCGHGPDVPAALRFVYGSVLLLTNILCGIRLLTPVSQVETVLHMFVGNSECRTVTRNVRVR